MSSWKSGARIWGKYAISAKTRIGTGALVKYPADLAAPLRVGHSRRNLELDQVSPPGMRSVESRYAPQLIVLSGKSNAEMQIPAIQLSGKPGDNVTKGYWSVDGTSAS